MNEEQEKALDNQLLDKLDIEPYTKLSTGLVLVVHRQLQTLSDKTGVAVKDMDREFIVENLCSVKVT